MSLRNRILACALFAIGLFAAPAAHAFLYAAPEGTTKDNCVVWHDGRYYLLTMYRKERTLGDILDQWHHMWLATSADGVHWESEGRAIADAPWPIFAMRAWPVGDRFILDHGSFTGPNQDVLRFWESPDLRTWRYLGPEFDVRRPDGQRLDHMDVVPVEENGKRIYYGYAVGGVLRSEDGAKWNWLRDFDFTEPCRYRVVLEPGGCERIDGRFYLLAGGFFPGDYNYDVYTYIADAPAGPFRPDHAALRLTGNNGRAMYGIWAGYCRTPDGLLLINYILDPSGLFWWHAPMKKAILDPQGHLRPGYWNGNDAMKGEAIAIDLAAHTPAFVPQGGRVAKQGDALEIVAPATPSPRWLNPGPPSMAMAMLNTALDDGNGYVLEGRLSIIQDPNAFVFPAIGLCIEQQASTGCLTLFESWEQTEIGTLKWSDGAHFDSEDRIGVGCATVAGLTPNETHSFRVLFRKGLFEVYLDDRLVQTYGAQGATGRVGFLAQDGIATIQDVKAWRMNLAQ